MENAHKQLIKTVEVILKQINDNIDGNLNSNDALTYTNALLNVSHIINITQTKMQE